MHTLVDLTSQDAMILRRLAMRPWANRAFRVCRAMQACDVTDAGIMLILAESSDDGYALNRDTISTK